MKSIRVERPPPRSLLVLVAVIEAREPFELEWTGVRGAHRGCMPDLDAAEGVLQTAPASIEPGPATRVPARSAGAV